MSVDGLDPLSNETQDFVEYFQILQTIQASEQTPLTQIEGDNQLLVYSLLSGDTD